jgi:trehalose synthase
MHPPATRTCLRALLAAAAVCALGAPRGPADRPAPDRTPAGADPETVRWLEERSMLAQAARLARTVSGSPDQWRHPYGEPRPREAVRLAPVWLLDYAGSVIPRPGRSVVATWAEPAYWDALRDLGIDLLHTGPVHRSGGVEGTRYTPTTDGWFDPISLEIDPALGTEEEFRRLVRVAGEHGGLVGGSLVPLHTGPGPDFRLAQRAYKDYPGMYTMIEVPPEDWPLLPPVDGPWASALVPKDAAERLTRKGLIPGLINSCDADPDARTWSGWSASGEVPGVDGRVRRWVYLHYFKPNQPTLNWLDPSFAAQRAVAGDVVQTVSALGARVVRLDAVPFLGIEPQRGQALSRHYEHPLSVDGTDTVAGLVRKLGGWSFHELNVPLEDLKRYTAHGPDLSYDFFTRAQCLHALLTGDATPLRLAFGMLREAGVPDGTLVHDLQNHDEITYQLVELDHRKGQTFPTRDGPLTGPQLKERMLREMRAGAAGAAGPRNKLYRPEQDGLATTFAGFAAAALGVRDPSASTAEQREQIKRAHLLLAAANAMRPGVFSLSSWDLVGALPLPEGAVADWTKGGDWRWVNRGGVDLMGADPVAAKSAYGLPLAECLYGPLPAQLRDPDSFASRLKRLLAARKRYRLAEAELAAAPEVRDAGVCVLVLRLPAGAGVAVTALNFGRAAAEAEIDLSAERVGGRRAADAVSGEGAGEVSGSGRLTVRLPPLEGRTLVVAGPGGG